MEWLKTYGAALGAALVVLLYALFTLSGGFKKKPESKPNVVPCPDCGGKVSSQIKSCPHCGRPMG